MTVQMEINNPHYRRIVDEMAAVAGIDVPTLCAGIVERAVDEYALEVGAYKRACVLGRLPDDLVRNLEEGKMVTEG